MRPTELTVRNEPSATRKLRAMLDDVADEYPLSDDERFELKFAATEALTNALKGSRQEDPVRIRVFPKAEAIEVEVTDRGGVDPARGVEEEGGRGIPLMLALVDEVEFYSGAAGTRVRMRKRITPADDAPNF